MEVVGVGIVAIDVIDEVAEYPRDPLGGASQMQVVAAQLGCSCHWVGTTTDPEKDTEAAFAHAELAKFGVNCSTSTVLLRGSMPISYILASKATGSRTIVHSRDLHELTVDDFKLATSKLFNQSEDNDDAQNDGDTERAKRGLWFHFEGRNMEPVLEMMQFIRTHARNSRISVEIEALRYDWKLAKRLVMTSDYVFASKDYIRDNLGYQNAESFLQTEFKENQIEVAGKTQLKAVICPWGADGVYYLRLDEPGQVQRIATKSLDRVVESIGAGDTFIGASVAALSHKLPLEASLQLGCEIATQKCLNIGFEFSSDRRDKWIRFMHSLKK